MLNFKYIILFFLLIAFKADVRAQKLNFLIPDGAVLQHAGSIGYFSGGISYDLFKNKKGSLDFMYGYLPESKGGSFSTVSTKFKYRPFEINISKNLTFYPLNPGTFISYTVNKDFDLTWDRGQYPKGYYYWSEALRLHISLSNELKLNTSNSSSNKIKSLSLYYELNTNDVYIINYVQNNTYLSITDIFKVGLGMRASF